jgi:hypothetical protein
MRNRVAVAARAGLAWRPRAYSGGWAVGPARIFRDDSGPTVSPGTAKRPEPTIPRHEQVTRSAVVTGLSVPSRPAEGNPRIRICARRRAILASDGTLTCPGGYKDDLQPIAE